MSAAFTTPGNATWQTLLNEITLAYSERRQAIGQSAYVPEERIVQSAAYWRILQSWLELNCVSFIDHENGPLTDAGDAFLYFTLDNWRAAAGIHQNGFRRSVDGVIMLYGKMQAGDAIGPWIFEDLQKGFGALKKTWALPDGCKIKYRYYSYNASNYFTWNFAKSSFETAYLAGSVIEGGYISGIIYFTNFTQGYFNGNVFLPQTSVYPVKITIKNVPNFISRSSKIYVIVTPWTQLPPFVMNDVIFDGFDLSEIYENKMSLCGEVDLTDSDDMESNWRGPSLDEIPRWCNEPANDGSFNSRGFTSERDHKMIAVENCGAVITWNFTNA